MSLTTAQLVQNLPLPWQGLFGAMRLDHHHGDSVEIWYQTEAKSLYGCLPDWGGLLAGLLEQEPVCEGSSLNFKPRFVQLPSDIQRQFLKFILQHRLEIPLSVLESFVSGILSYQTSLESWPEVLLKTLSTFIQVQNSECDQYKLLTETSYTFSNENQMFASTLCEKLKQSKQPGFSNWTEVHVPWKKFVEKSVDGSIVEFDSPSGRPPGGETLQSAVHDDSPPAPDLVIPSPTHMQASADFITVLDDEEEMETSESATEQITEDSSKEMCISATDVIKHDGKVDPVLMSKGERLKECWQSGSETPSDIDLFLLAAPGQIKEVCRVLELDCLSESEVLQACQSVSTLSSIISQASSGQFMSSIVYPKVSALKQSASRQLHGVISLAAEHFPQSLIEDVFMGCINQGIGSPQTDLLCTAIKTGFTVSSRVHLLRKLLDSIGPLNDNVICVYQALLDTKVEISETILTDLINVLQTKCKGLEKNLKYGKLLLAVINKYGRQFSRRHCDILETEIQNHGTFLKKSLEAALRKFNK